VEYERVNGANDAAARWLAIHDELLRGITHALSNRIATIGATSYMLEHGDVAVAQTVEALRDESERMDTLLQQLRQLPARPGAEAEPMTVGDICANAIRVHTHHGDWRDFECDVVEDPDVYPVWGEPHAITHAVLVALTAAKRNAVPGSRVRIHISGDTSVVRISASAPSPNDTADHLNLADAEAASWLLAFHGGTARTLEHGCELEIPTLVAVRRARKG
jgi:signal transduction histidine kinase